MVTVSPAPVRPTPAIADPMADTFFMDKIYGKRISMVSSEATSSPERPTLQLNELEANDETGGSGRPQTPRCSPTTRAYLSVFGAFLALFCTFGDINSFGTFQAWYLTHQLHSMSPSAISWIGSVQLFIFFFLGLIIGRAYDAIGPRFLMIVGTGIYSTSIMLLSISHTYTELLIVQGVLSSTGAALLFYPPIAAVSSHFTKYKATAVGIALAGSSLGGLVFPIALRKLFDVVGFAWAVRAMGFLCLILCTIAVFTVSACEAANEANRPWIDLECFQDSAFVFLFVGSFFIAFGLFIPYIYIIEYSINQGIKSTTAFYTLSVMNGAGLIGRLFPALLSDFCGRFNLLIPSALFSGILCCCLWPFCGGDLGKIMAFSATYGLFSSAFISLVNPCVAQISHPSRFGTRMGALYSLIALPALLGGPMAGLILKRSHGNSFVPVMIVAGVCLVVGSCIIIPCRLLLSKSIKAKV